MAVDFKKKIAGKKTKLAGKSLDTASSSSQKPIDENYQEGNLYRIPLSSIAPDPNQPRKNFDEKKLAELATSIQNKGVLQPIIIRSNDIDGIDSEFLVVAGERRYRAAKQVGLEQIPALFTAGDPAEIALIENLQRDDLKPVEEAEAYYRVMQSHNYNQNQLSKVVGKARTTINEILTLNNLPEEVKAECRASDTPKNVLIEIAKRKDSKEMISLFNRVKGENLTVAKIRQLTRPKPARLVRDIDERTLEKIIQGKILLQRIEKGSLSNNSKEKLKNEVEELYEITKGLIGD